ncbi:MAG: cation-translocating P-type ATPase [Anaerolineae bacterium]|nr:cation-translocating P-type ATPase [Anaerolineae bacterium]
MAAWHTLERERIYEQLDTSPDGLDEAEVARRLERYGSNELEERGLRSPWKVLLAQFTEIMVVVLLIAAMISLVVGETTDAIMIMIIVILNAILGFTQEYRAERAIAALKQLSVPAVRVRRDGQIREVEATSLVPGDVVLLEAGDRVPADARVVESVNLRAEEAALTGESVPVDKMEQPLEDESLPLGDRRNMVFMGTSIAYGRGSALVVQSGMETQLGNIADMLQQVSEERTPLQRKMAELGKWLAVASFVLVAVVFGVGVWQGEAVQEMFLTAVSLAVAAVPEGLPAVVTIALALGAQRMVRRNALIRKLPAVETLGSVTTICSDKTGTLTENRMTVTVLDVAGTTLNLTTRLKHTGATLSPDEEPIVEPDPQIALLLAGGALCNDASLQPSDHQPDTYETVGDPTEGALVVAAARLGLWKSEMEKVMPRVAEVPFTSERKRMTTVHQSPNGAAPAEGDALTRLLKTLPDSDYVVFTKGAVDQLVDICDRVWNEGHVEPLDAAWRERIEVANDGLAQEGMRVLGVAMRPLDEVPEQAEEGDLETQEIFVGLTGMIDPPRAEVRDAVAECRTAGIRPVMITGDHPLTALHIARDLGIVQEERQGDDQVITGRQLADMPVEELETRVRDISVYARVSPEHKVKIVEAVKVQGEIVAMTGDGVNDAPALKRADIGVAMGITGTDVSKEASDMVLLDDNFATIVHAVEEGRTIYENIRKFVKYTMSSNVGEILVMLVAPLLGLPIPLNAIQILWINLVTDGLPGLALSLEPAAPDTMNRPPHPPGESVLARGLGTYILWVGPLMGLVALLPEFLAVSGIGGLALGGEAYTTMVFTTLALAQMGNALAIRSDRFLLAQLGLFTNLALLAAVVLTFLLQMAVVYVPFLQGIFDTVALTPRQLLLSLGFSTIVFIVVEVVKWIRQQVER